MKKILILFSMLLGLMSSLYAIDEYGDVGFIDGSGNTPLSGYTTPAVGSDMASDAEVFGIKPDNPTGLLASGARVIKDNLEISGCKEGGQANVATIATVAVVCYPRGVIRA